MEKKKTKTETKKETKQKREHQKPWQEVYASIEDIKAFLNERVMLRYNVITKRTEVHVIERDPDPPQEGAPPEAYIHWMEESLRPSPAVEPDAYYVPLVDRQVNTLWSAMSHRQPVRLQDMQRVIESDFVPEYHPFRHYLEHLPPWHEGDDDYIMELSLTVNVKGGADEQIRFLEYLRKWLVAMVATSSCLMKSAVPSTSPPSTNYIAAFSRHIHKRPCFSSPTERQSVNYATIWWLFLPDNSAIHKYHKAPATKEMTKYIPLFFLRV